MCLYDERFHRYNVHLMMHLHQSVVDFGPLSDHSTFASEDQIGSLRDLIKSYNNIPQQIMNKYCLRLGAFNFINRLYNNENLSVNEYQLLEKLLPPNKLKIKFNLDGKFIVKHLSESQINAINDVYEIEPNSMAKFYERCTIKGFTVCTDNYCKDFNFSNCYVKILKSKYYVIKNIIDINSNIVLLAHEIIIATVKGSKSLIIDEGKSKFNIKYIHNVEHINECIIKCLIPSQIQRCVLYLPKINDKYVTDFDYAWIVDTNLNNSV